MHFVLQFVQTEVELWIVVFMVSVLSNITSDIKATVVVRTSRVPKKAMLPQEDLQIILLPK